MPTVVKQRSWPVAVAAGSVLAVLLVAGAWRVVADSALENGQSEDGQSDDSSSEDGSSEDGPAAGQGADCDAAQEAAGLRGEGMTLDELSSPSAFHLAANSSAAVRGRPVATSRASAASTVVSPAGTIVELDVTSVSGLPISPGSHLAIWIPTVQAPPDPPGGEIVAYLTGDEVPGTSGDSTAAVVQLGGLWLGCDGRSPAEPVFVGGENTRWPVRPSLDDLWRIFTAAASAGETEVEPTDGRSSAVYDVRLESGDRLRVTVPSASAQQLTLVDEQPRGPTSLIGDGLSIEIVFAPCNDGSMTANVHGTLVSEPDDDGTVRVCRREELLALTVDIADLSSIVSADPAGWADGLDIRSIEIGQRYAAVLTTARPDLTDCSNCAPWGPMIHPEDDVVVNRTSPTAVVAVDVDNLTRRWSFAAGPGAIALRPATDAVVLDVAGGPLISLDPATGDERWRLPRHPDEQGQGLHELTGRNAVAWSSFAGDGDSRPPVLRWVDTDAGSIGWEAVGRGGSDWQRTDPVLVDGLVLAMDVLDTSAIAAGEPGSQLNAFDVIDGRLRWTLDVGSRAGSLSRHVLEVVDQPTGQTVVGRTTDGAVFRVDPATGAELWRTRLDADRFDGTDVSSDGTLALVVDTEFGRRLVDLETGELLDR